MADGWKPFRDWQNGRPDRMILVAIDDDDMAWYEMIIPFVLSLGQTDYDGRLGIISYGLSPAKVERLERSGISVFPPAGSATLACDRFRTAARIIGSDPALQALALYDADIWFPGPHLDLFAALQDETSLHVAPDSQFSTFITSPIKPHADHLKAQCAASALSGFGAAVQAGMVLGGRAAWRDFDGHIEACLARVGVDFSQCYGLDTTFLQLWATEGHVVKAPVGLNFVPKWGVHEHHDYRGANRVVLEHDGRSIQALHMTRDCRFENKWRYFALRSDEAMALGGALCLDDADSLQACPDDECAAAATILRPFGFELKRLVARDPVVGASLLPHGGFSIQGWSSMEIELVSLARQKTRIVSTFLHNQPSPLAGEILINGAVAVRQMLSFTADGHLDEGTEVTLRSHALPGQVCNSIWNVSTQPIGSA